MVEQLTLQTIGVGIAAASVVIGVCTWIVQIRENKRINQARLFMEIYERFTDKGFWDMVNEIRAFDYVDYDDFEKKYSQYDLNSAFAVASVFEGIGVLVKRGLIDIRLVNDLMPLTIMSVWEKMTPIILVARDKGWGSRYAYKGFQYLNNKVIETHEQHLKDWDT